MSKYCNRRYKYLKPCSINEYCLKISVIPCEIFNVIAKTVLLPPSIGHFVKHTYRRNKLCWSILKFKAKKQISKIRGKVVQLSLPSHIILRAEGYWIGQDNSNIISTFHLHLREKISYILTNKSQQ